MYYTGLNPFDMKKVYVPKGEEKLMQRALLQYSDPANHNLVIKALKKAGREDLIGFGPDCLVRPRLLRDEKENSNKSKQRKGKTNELSDFRRKKSITKGKRRTENKGGRPKGKRR